MSHTINSHLHTRDSDGEFQPVGDGASDEKIPVEFTASSDGEGNSYLDEDGNVLTVKHKVIDHATSGNNTIVAAVVGKKIRVLALTLVTTDAVVVRFESDTDGTALTGQMPFGANSGIALNMNNAGHFETVSGELLNIELDGAVSVDGWLKYVEV